MATKPWAAVVRNSVPTNYKRPQDAGASPEATLELEYVHGYRCEDARNNLRYTKNGTVVFHTAAVGVVLNPENNTQTHFFEHTDDILCLAIHPDMQTLATGEIGPNPLICVWDSATSECLARIMGTLKKGVCQLAFSNNGKLLAAAAADDYHCVAIYDWNECRTQLKGGLGKGRSGGLVATGQVSRVNILSLVFNPTDDLLVATGVKEVNFISFAGGSLKTAKGSGWKAMRPQAVLCGAFIGTTLVTGTFNGQLLTWRGRTIEQTINAHTGCVNSIWYQGRGAGFLTGGNDGLVIVWNPDFSINHKINVATAGELKPYNPRVRSVCEDSKGSMLVGTRSGDIMELRKSGARGLLRSHFEKELWGLAVHPRKPEFATVGQDSLFILWNIKTRKHFKAPRLVLPS
jgi:WD40 repeat protein